MSNSRGTVKDSKGVSRWISRVTVRVSKGVSRGAGHGFKGSFEVEF